VRRLDVAFPSASAQEAASSVRNAKRCLATALQKSSLIKTKHLPRLVSLDEARNHDRILHPGGRRDGIWQDSRWRGIDSTPGRGDRPYGKRREHAPLAMGACSAAEIPPDGRLPRSPSCGSANAGREESEHGSSPEDRSQAGYTIRCEVRPDSQSLSRKPDKGSLQASAKRIGALFTTLPDAKALFDRKAAIFIDARHSEDYDLEHIPGAVSLFVEDLDKLYEGALGAVPKDRTLVTYCSDPQCGTATKLADALAARGYTRVLILLEGLPGWKGAGYPTEKEVTR